MNCDLYIVLINGHLDGSNTAAEEETLQAHLKACEDCRALLSAMEENDALIKASMVEPPADLTTRIMQKVRNNPKRNSKKTFYTSVAAAALAGAAMLGIFISGSVQPPKSESAGIAVVSETEHAAYGNAAKRSVHTAVGVLVLRNSSKDIDFEGEALDINSLPAAVMRAGYPVSGKETEAYSVSWDELTRIHKAYGGSLYNPEANTFGILILVD